MPDQITEIATFYDKLRNKIVKRQQTELTQLQRARDAALRVFQKPAAPANGAPRVRKSRLDREVKTAILSVLSFETAHSVGHIIASLGNVTEQQVRSVMRSEIRGKNVVSEGTRGNKRYRFAFPQEASHASE